MDQPTPQKVSNKLRRWGDFEDDSDKKKEVQADDIILTEEKSNLMLTIQNTNKSLRPIRLKHQNAMVTQTVEVMHQTEMIQTLIDTYADKSNGNYVLNHNQILPNIDFPPENTANLLSDRKLAKPLWFVRPKETKFTRGVPKRIPPISKPIADSCLRKSVCGLLKMSDFFQSTDSALVLFTDAVDHFYRTFMDSLNETVLLSGPPSGAEKGRKLPNDKNRKLDVAAVEKAYQSLTSESLAGLHNYYKNTIIAKNAQEIEEFSEIFGEYKKLQQESQELNRSSVREEENMVDYLDYQSLMTIDGQPQQIFSQEGMGQIMSYVDSAGTEHHSQMEMVTDGSGQEFLMNISNQSRQE